MFAESARDPAQLLCPLHDVFMANIVAMFQKELLNFVFEFGNFLVRSTRSRFVSPLATPRAD